MLKPTLLAFVLVYYAGLFCYLGCVEFFACRGHQE
jgi:hypothetical protein